MTKRQRIYAVITGVVAGVLMGLAVPIPRLGQAARAGHRFSPAVAVNGKRS